MNTEKFNEIISEMINACKVTLVGKAREYAGNDDRLHNFRCAAGLQGCSEKEALYGMMAKHIVSLSDMCRDGKNHPPALWAEKIGDTINYCLLLYAMVREEAEMG